MARKRRRNRGKGKQMAQDPRGMGQPMPMAGPPGAGGPPGASPGMAQGMGAAMPSGEADASEGEGESNVTPEEQAIYHKFMENYYTLMYIGGSGQDGKQQPKLAEDVRGYFDDMSNPTEALANATVTAVRGLAESAEVAGKPIPPDVLLHAGTEVMEDIAELAESDGKHEYTQEELDGALYRAMDIWRDLHQDKIDPNALKEDYDTLFQANQSGRLGEVLPGVEEAAKKLPAPEVEGEAMPPEAAAAAPVQPDQQPRGLGQV